MALATEPLRSPEVLPLLILGAGPHALAIALALIEHDERWRHGLAVVDPSGRWLAAWDDQFARQGIARLRSAGVHHPHPDPTELVVHLRALGRDHELHAPYDSPSTSGFRTFCDHLIHDGQLDELVVPASALNLCVRDGAVHVLLSNAQILTAARVVVATNPSIPRLPVEVRAGVHGHGPLRHHRRRPWRHACDVDVRRLGDQEGRRVDVVGGGLTAVQLALAACRHGARVRLLSRRPLVERAFDVDPGWLGPRHLDRYGAAAPPRRRALIDLARGGGSVPRRDLDYADLVRRYANDEDFAEKARAAALEIQAQMAQVLDKHFR